VGAYADMEKMIDADLIGIGKLLKQSRFSVPPHQRPYAWLEGEVMDLYRDINDALKRNKEEYFLGTSRESPQSECWWSLGAAKVRPHRLQSPAASRRRGRP